MKKWCDYIINTAKKRRGKMKHPKEIDQYLWNTGHQYGGVAHTLSQTVDEQTKALQNLSILLYTARQSLDGIPVGSWQIQQHSSPGHTSDELYYDDIASRMKSAIQKD